MTAAVGTYARVTLLGITRRRLTIVILIALPLVFYAVSHDAPGRSVRSLLFGLSWALSTVAFFTTSASRNVEPRLVLAGWRRAALTSARLTALAALAMALAAALWAIVAVDQQVRSLSAVAVDFVVTAAVAILFGTAVGALIHGELQGALTIFFFAGLQAVANPFDSWTKALPFWSSRELGTWAIDGPTQGSLQTGLMHALVWAEICVAVLAISERRHSSAIHAREI